MFPFCTFQNALAVDIYVDGSCLFNQEDDVNTYSSALSVSFGILYGIWQLMS